MHDPSEFRFKVDLLIRVFGMDADSHAFFQDAHAPNISDHGAQLSGLEKQLRPGYIIGQQFGDTRARCKVIWARDAGSPRETEAGVRIVEGQSCPWQEEIEKQRATAALPISRAVPVAKNRRKFRRLPIPFPIEIGDGQALVMHLRASTQDIAGRGCYVETLQPLPVGKLLEVTFWSIPGGSRPRRLSGPAMAESGTGIEFIGLDEATQNQLQEQVEALAAESGLFKHAHGAL